MKICGIKLSHDAAVCGIENGKLLFCTEIEKLDNNPRYSKMFDQSLITRILDDEDFHPDAYAVDGWKFAAVEGLPVASYTETDQWSESKTLRGLAFTGPGLKVRGIDVAYTSFPHILGHILGSYCTSPWAKAREPAYVVTWDGGTQPRLHLVSPDGFSRVEYFGSIHPLYSFIYGAMGRYFGPFKVEGLADRSLSSMTNEEKYGGYELPGKLMSYIAKGRVDESLAALLMRAADDMVPTDRYDQEGLREHGIIRRAYHYAQNNHLSDEDALLTIHTFLERLLVDRVRKMIPAGHNFIFTGGSALNIKWNSALRESGHFKAMWVPPFPNDAGSALGAACSMMVQYENRWDLDWSVYAGPMMQRGEMVEGWTSRPCSVKELAAHLHDHPTVPVLLLHGRAEIGPRALGHRSIVMSPYEDGNKAILNAFKKREDWRPVAPICAEDWARAAFHPGTPDPYMLYDHVVRDNWRTFLPAIVHIDGTARLQTINEEQCSVTARLLEEYGELTGCPILCNTSANLNGSGFFPSVEEAMRWDQVPAIWFNGELFSKVA